MTVGHSGRKSSKLWVVVLMFVRKLCWCFRNMFAIFILNLRVCRTKWHPNFVYKCSNTGSSVLVYLNIQACIVSQISWLISHCIPTLAQYVFFIWFPDNIGTTMRNFVKTQVVRSSRDCTILVADVGGSVVHDEFNAWDQSKTVLHL